MKPSTSPWRIEIAATTHKAGIWGNLESGWTVKHSSWLQWACDDCLGAGRAVEAKPWMQTYGYGFARFAYFNETKTCTDCGQEFLFSASEQAYWYETLQFSPYSVPKQCTECRKTRRKVKGAHLELGRIHAQFNGSIEEMVQLADLYMAIGNAPKALEHLRRAKNKARSTATREELMVRIAAISPG